MKPVFKPVFAVPVVLLLAAGCSMQGGGRDVQSRRDPVTPQPTGCSSLDVNTCSTNPSCQLTRSVCPDCAANGTCANTTCVVCQDKQPQGSPCINLDESQCLADPLCHASYTQLDCAMVMPLDGGPFEGCPTVYTGCSVNLPPQDPCMGLPEAQCVAPFCRPIYGAIAAVGGTPPPYLGCQVNVTSCLNNCDCAVNEYCRMSLLPTDPLGGANCVAAPQPTGVCTRVPGMDPEPVGTADAGAPVQAP